MKENMTVERAMRQCAWCNNHISEDVEVFGIGGRFGPGMDLSEYEGGVMPVEIITCDRTIFTFVPTADSPAREDGNDFLCMTCSLSCANSLKEALDRDIELGKTLEAHILQL